MIASGLGALALCFVALVGQEVPVPQAPEPLGRRVLEPFDYMGVTLEPGPLRRQVDQVKAFYLAISDDDLLKGFRARAGRPAPGRDLGGWYSSDTFLVFGQIVSGLARLYAATGDPACRDKANHLIAGWAECIEPDGYFFASRKPNAPHYIYDKMLWGLIDAHLYCQNSEALVHLGRITDWARRNLDRGRRINDTSTEWYTLSENLYRAYLITGDPSYREFAALWEYPAYWGVYEKKGDLFAARPDGSRTPAYHAYSHVNTLGGAAAAYRVTGDQRYLTTIQNAFDMLQRDQCYATGGYGPDEQLLPPDVFRTRLGETHNTFETQCGSWAAFKLAKSLIGFTGDARYGDWVERLMLNGIGASLPMTDDGRVFYYSDYNFHGGTKRNTDFGWSCCTGTRPQAMADLADLVFFHDSRTLYVNLFTPSSVSWTTDGHHVSIAQATAFPESDEVVFTVSVKEPVEFSLALRSPGWLAGPVTGTIGDEPAKLAVESEHHWVLVPRTWSNGDRLAVRLPMKVWSAPLSAESATPATVLVGPVVLAFEAPHARALRDLDTSSPETWLAPQQDRPLEFDVVGKTGVRARPFASIGPRERYFVYLDPAMGNHIPHSDLRFTGAWNNAGVFRFSNEVGATADGEFEGTGVRWLGRKFDDAGIAEVAIDGNVVAAVDQYAPGRDLPFDWSHQGLAPGRHTIRIRILPGKADASRDRFVNVAGLEILGDTGP
jgi:DUF1680 family protein